MGTAITFPVADVAPVTVTAVEKDGLTAWMEVTVVGVGTPVVGKIVSGTTGVVVTVGVKASAEVVTVKVGASTPVVTMGEEGADDERASLPASVRVRVCRPELITLSIMWLVPPVSSGRSVMPWPSKNFIASSGKIKD